MPTRPQPVHRRRVLIDALSARFGGTAYGVVQLAGRLSERDDVEAVTVVARSGSLVELGLRTQPAVRSVALPERARGELLARVLWEAASLDRLVRAERAGVVITTSGMLPRRLSARVICLLFNPVMFQDAGAANALRRWAVRRTAGHAAHVLAPSRHMASIASSALGRQVEVVALGVDHSVFAPATAPGEEILCVADLYLHKRHDLVIDAWLALDAPRPTLRLIGNPRVDPVNYRTVAARARSLSGSGTIVLEHDLSMGALADAYRRARIFVLASERESFCMPLAEAMSCGVPAIVRGLASLRETGGEGARYVEGDDPLSWSREMSHLLEDDAMRAEASAAARKAASRFSWATMASELAARL